ncbi:MAG TPA: tyrosine-type recombinase/integrase, partial [Myxococcota bacterium]|nr:tyrosine-type recombinase/integrase [Myxococcota bacterium]
MTDLLPIPPPEIVPAGAAAISPELLAGQLAASSIKMYRRDWAAYADWCAGAACPPGEASSLARWRAHLAGGTDLAPNTINRMLSAVKRVAKEAHAQGFLSAEGAAAFAAIVGVKALALKARSRAHARTRIEPADMRRLCEAPDRTTLKGLRDAALLATLASSAVRVSELCALQVGSILHRKSGYLVTVLGKTDVEPREAPLSREAYALIQEWIKARPVLSAYVFTGF